MTKVKAATLFLQNKYNKGVVVCLIRFNKNETYWEYLHRTLKGVLPSKFSEANTTVYISESDNGELIINAPSKDAKGYFNKHKDLIEDINDWETFTI